MEIERSIVINRSIGDAFDFVSDARSDPRWSPKLDSVEQVSGETVLAPEAAT